MRYFLSIVSLLTLIPLFAGCQMEDYGDFEQSTAGLDGVVDTSMRNWNDRSGWAGSPDGVAMDADTGIVGPGEIEDERPIVDDDWADVYDTDTDIILDAHEIREPLPTRDDDK